eukprot:14761-Pelagomonas_calceolata.AAC.1
MESPRKSKPSHCVRLHGGALAAGGASSPGPAAAPTVCRRERLQVTGVSIWAAFTLCCDEGRAQSLTLTLARITTLFSGEHVVCCQVAGSGLPASPGAAVGQAVFSAEEAEAWVAAGQKVGGMERARGGCMTQRLARRWVVWSGQKGGCMPVPARRWVDYSGCRQRGDERFAGFELGSRQWSSCERKCPPLNCHGDAWPVRGLQGCVMGRVCLQPLACIAFQEARGAAIPGISFMSCLHSCSFWGCLCLFMPLPFSYASSWASQSRCMAFAQSAAGIDTTDIALCSENQVARPSNRSFCGFTGGAGAQGDLPRGREGHVLCGGRAVPAGRHDKPRCCGGAWLGQALRDWCAGAGGELLGAPGNRGPVTGM